MKKNINEMTLKELQRIENFLPESEFDSIVIVPTKYIHDSGFTCMKYILLDGMEIVGAISGSSDVLHLNGIGGFGKRPVDFSKEPKGYGWAIDCLKKSKCTRIFCGQPLELEKCSFFVSSVEIFVKE